MSGSIEERLLFDETNLALLERIESDFDVSLETLSNELGISKSTVHYRLTKLRESGVIRRTVAELDPVAFGLDMVMITEVSVAHEKGYADEIGEQLKALPGVQQVYYTMGDADFVVISRLQNRDQMNNLIDEVVSIKGVDETSSRFVMKELTTDTGVFSNLSSAMRAKLLEY
ncbi:MULTISPECIES: Lrp/AsnC family transcriptional regulator [Haloferax]|uniref:Winged helix-turn-helix transcriptional regulator n=2 Tax=Haloferax TaxID=2251 RepID=A0A6G1Z6C7_9EURY|nr:MULTISPECIES: Lrp/AsnC family transcriptional regulator [Haloferax]KAB1185445.1 Lrp/AsnC family transcriptional regulator [Haloferax sp. CBA1149]MRW82092.1 winged helix-turn-helix transcriptional regulator [Haloferax marinisediminis]